MQAVRRLLALVLAICLLPSLGEPLARMLGAAGECEFAHDGEIACRVGAGALVAAVTVAAAVGRLAAVTVPIAVAVLVFWALAEAARLMGDAKRPPRDD